jgi:hypothetical protein
MIGFMILSAGWITNAASPGGLKGINAILAQEKGAWALLT